MCDEGRRYIKQRIRVPGTQSSVGEKQVDYQKQCNECYRKGMSQVTWGLRGGALRVKGIQEAEDSESWTYLCISLRPSSISCSSLAQNERRL